MLLELSHTEDDMNTDEMRKTLKTKMLHCFLWK